MKRTLPTVHGRARRGTPRPVAPRERAVAPQPLVTIGWANQAREAGQFALQLCAALIARGLPVGVLIAAERSDTVTEVSLGQFLQAGAQAAKWLQLPAQDTQRVLADALAQLAGPALIVALGNVLPVFYRPFFSVVVSGHRRQRIPDDANVLQADLEITSASDGLAEELAKLLQGRLGGVGAQPR